MVDRIGGSESLWREAILAAQKELARDAGGVARDARALQDAARSFADRVEVAGPSATRPGAIRPEAGPSAAGRAGDPRAVPETGTAMRTFSEVASEGLADVAGSLREVDQLPRAMVAGEVEGFQELAVRVKSADLSFRFALEVRNKLIDAYREVMRMSV
jgi:flagellar hook-basal body complex protein FliE